MELLEALVLSFIGTMIVTPLYVIQVKRIRKVKVYDPFFYKLDESGALKEVTAESIPEELIEALRQKVLSEFKPPSKTRQMLPIIIFALAIFIIYMIILLSIFGIST
ncbi:MAG: hypothetical protein QW128_04435 [Thermoprotei archaeon]